MNRETQALLDLLQSPDPANMELARQLYVNADVDKAFFGSIFSFIDKNFDRDEEGRVMDWGLLDFSEEYDMEIPAEITHIYLDTLYCFDSDIRQIPPLPPTIKYLDCSGNELRFLPEMPNLDYLFCAGNPLKMLPPLPKLRFLYVWGTDLTDLPDLPLIETLHCNNKKFSAETVERLQNKYKDIPNLSLF
jgi:hypothetical protein